MNDKIKITLISSITAIIVALITGYFSVILTVKNQHSSIEQLTIKINDLKQRADTIDKMNNLPVGSIVASALNPNEFRRAVNDPEDFNLLKSRWTLADDKGKVPGTKYSELTNNSKIPDLRGVFLRGNSFGRFGIKTVLGEFNSDQIATHFHELKFTPIDIANQGAQRNPGEGSFISGSGKHKTELTGGIETLPKNVIVNYYIRIN